MSDVAKTEADLPKVPQPQYVRDLTKRVLELEAQLAHRHIIGKAYEVSRESINRLAGELDECREDVAHLKEENQHLEDRIAELAHPEYGENKQLAAELDLRLKQIAALKHELEARMETEKRLMAALEKIQNTVIHDNAWYQRIARESLKDCTGVAK